MTTISIKEISRNINKLQDYDYIDIEDKKTKEHKGLLVSSKYADEIKMFLKNKLAKKKQQELDELMQFSGIFNGESEDKSVKDIKTDKIDRYSFDE